MVNVKVKWTKQTFDVDLDPNESVSTFKAQLFALTGVPVDRQKLMSTKLWKGMLKDDASFTTMKVVPGSQIMLMGSAEVVVEPQQKAVFVEDMTVEQVAQSGHELPAGLVNLGNTCYLNATLQCLRKVPELRDNLDKYGGRLSNEADNDMIISLRDTFKQLDTSLDSVTPLIFVDTLRRFFPQFAQMGRGGYMQQDSEEFLQTLFSTLTRRLQPVFPTNHGQPSKSLIHDLFGLEMQETYRCTESEAEPVTTVSASTFNLTCNISNTTNHLAEGIKLSLSGSVEKRSSVLGRDAVWQKESRINKLPRYLCVQFMRFYWKATPESRDHAGVKCKMLRPISFPLILDVFDFCSDELQAVLKVPRDKHADAILNEFKKTKAATGAEGASAAGVEESKGEDEDKEMEDVDPEEKAALEAAKALSVGVDRTAGPGLPQDFKGNYELFAVVTHKGRSADSGHYMGWVRQQGDDWLCFDDDVVSPCKSEDIQKLKGGGDWHMTYLSFYRYKD